MMIDEIFRLLGFERIRKPSQKPVKVSEIIRCDKYNIFTPNELSVVRMIEDYELSISLIERKMAITDPIDYPHNSHNQAVAISELREKIQFLTHTTFDYLYGNKYDKVKMQ